MAPALERYVYKLEQTIDCARLWIVLEFFCGKHVVCCFGFFAHPMCCGAGYFQWRRVVVSGIGSSANPGEWTNPNNRTWKIDRPFSIDLTQDQVCPACRNTNVNQSSCFACVPLDQFTFIPRVIEILVSRLSALPQHVLV